MALAYLQELSLDAPFELEQGGVLQAVEVAFETWGERNAADDNTILLCHAFSGSSHAARHDAEDLAGWWELVVGPGKPIDTNEFHVVCPNILGGCNGTTGPSSLDPETGKPYGSSFPAITVGDIVALHARVLDHLGIDEVAAVVGGSLGGHQALAWGAQFPTRARKIAAIACSHRLTNQAMAASVIARNAILLDPHFHGGDYYHRETKPVAGLALARMLANTTYFSEHSLGAFAAESAGKEIPHPFHVEPGVGVVADSPVAACLAEESQLFVRRFDANTFLLLSSAMERFNLGDSEARLSSIFCDSASRWLLLSFSTDTLFPTSQMGAIAEALSASGRPVSWHDIQCNHGHDSFLLEEDLPTYGKLIHDFLEE